MQSGAYAGGVRRVSVLFTFPKDLVARVAGMDCSMSSCDWLLLICASCLLQFICGAGGAYFMMRQMRQAPAANVDEIENPPEWAGKGEPAPISYVQFEMQTSSKYMVTQDQSIKCEHPRLSKRGTNQFAAKVRCESCCQVLANYVFPHKA